MANKMIADKIAENPDADPKVIAKEVSDELGKLRQ